VDAPPAFLEVGHVGLRARTLVAQFPVAPALGLVEEPRFGARVGDGGVRDQRHLVGREVAPPGRRVDRGQRLESYGRFERVASLADRGAGGAGEVMRRRPVAVALPQACFGDPRGGERLHRCSHLLDRGRVLDDLRHIGNRQPRRIESDRVRRHRAAQLRQPHARTLRTGCDSYSVMRTNARS
jgi:hypothetical protein